jgi:NAD(P)-dependent dehydrogenase (short-subunit alcohol dehydrogenase family)
MPSLTLVTGAAGALGSALCRDLARRGHQLALVDIPAASARLSELAKEVGGLALPLDATQAAAWAEPLARVERERGALTGAVLVAGGWQGGKPLHESDDAVWDAMLQLNLQTAYRALKAVLPGLVQRKKGSIVVIGSRAAERPWSSANAAAYAASKGAAVALAEAVAAEVLESGVRVNSVLPSTIDTPANRKSMPNADPTRWVSPESLAAVIAFLLSDESRDVSGAALPVYGRA